MGETQDSLGAILRDYVKWLGPPIAVACSECSHDFTAPQNSNGALVKVCVDCWYKPKAEEMP